jgi:cell shape-determining protein MreC
MSFECEFCKKRFSNKSTLSTHKKNTKKCLKLQSELNIKNIKFTDELKQLQEDLLKYESIRLRQIEEIKELKQTISKLQEENISLSERLEENLYTNVNNIKITQVINASPDMSDERIIAISNKCTEELIKSLEKLKSEQ